MSDKRFILQKPEAMLFFNALTDLGYDRNLGVSVPLLGGTTIFKAHAAGRTVTISDFIDQRAYRQAADALTRRMRDPGRREVPDYGALRQLFYAAGILAPAGVERLAEILADLRSRDVTRGGDVYFLAPDTNLVRDRFYSVWLSRQPPHQNLDFLLCDTVRDELRNRRDKFKKNDLKGLKPLSMGLLEECFLNQNCLEDRMRYVGFLEYNRMRAATSCEEIDAPSSKRSGLENDRFIQAAYSGFVGVGRKVVFLSRDNEAVQAMSGEDNVIPVLLEHPPFYMTDFAARWGRFLDFLYLLGVLFGRIDLSVGGMKTASLYGVWRGKDAEEWETDRLRLDLVRPDGGDREEQREFAFISDRMAKNLAVLRKLKDASEPPASESIPRLKP